MALVPLTAPLRIMKPPDMTNNPLALTTLGSDHSNSPWMGQESWDHHWCLFPHPWRLLSPGEEWF